MTERNPSLADLEWVVDLLGKAAAGPSTKARRESLMTGLGERINAQASIRVYHQAELGAFNPQEVEIRGFSEDDHAAIIQTSYNYRGVDGVRASGLWSVARHSVVSDADWFCDTAPGYMLGRSRPLEWMSCGYDGGSWWSIIGIFRFGRTRFSEQDVRLARLLMCQCLWVLGPSSGSEDRSHVPRLTLTQQEVLWMLAHGLSKAEIAAKTGRALATIDSHVRAIYTVLAVHDRASLTRRVLGTG